MTGVVAWFPIPLPRLRLEPADGRRRGLFERSEFRSRPICDAKTEGDKRQRGVIFFDYFLLHKQKKMIRCRATPVGDAQNAVASSVL